MKTKLIIFALLCGAVFAEDNTIRINGIDKTTPLTVTSTGAKVVNTHDILVKESANMIFRLSGLPQDQVVASSNGYLLAIPTYHAPEKPEEVKVEVWTKDGKHWVAEWKEVKERE